MQTRKKDRVNNLEIRPSKEVLFQHKTLEERALEFGGKLNLDGEYDWGIPVGREIWCG